MTDKKYYWEDFHTGKILTFGSKRVTREEIVEFAQDFDPEIFHLDDEAAKDSMLGGLAASGWHSCSLMMRMMCDGFLLHSASMGSPGIDESRWIKPVFVDDVLSVRVQCLETRASSSRPDMGLVHFENALMNQNNEILLTMTSWGMYARRTPGASTRQ